MLDEQLHNQMHWQVQFKFGIVNRIALRNYDEMHWDGMGWDGMGCDGDGMG